MLAKTVLVPMLFNAAASGATLMYSREGEDEDEEREEDGGPDEDAEAQAEEDENGGEDADYAPEDGGDGEEEREMDDAEEVDGSYMDDVAEGEAEASSEDSGDVGVSIMSVIILTLCFVSLGVGLLSYWCRTKGDRTFSSVETNPMQVLSASRPQHARIHPDPNNAPTPIPPSSYVEGGRGDDCFRKEEPPSGGRGGELRARHAWRQEDSHRDRRQPPVRRVGRELGRLPCFSCTRTRSLRPAWPGTAQHGLLLTPKDAHLRLTPRSMHR